ncbi:MAG: hypothetical protein FJX57_07270, partial [Alphaproteobacteria bacterium]|nr:hypothetical protein [Alphaproteobacteria bacterium]
MTPPDATASGGPTCVLLAPYFVMSWLYNPLVPELRRRYGTRFVIMIPEAAAQTSPFRALAGPNDRIVLVPSFDDMTAREAASGADDVFAAARRYEERYDASYTIDVLQQERPVAAAYVDATTGAIESAASRIGMLGMTRTVNGFFAFFEALLAAEPIDLVLAWPRSGAEAVLCRIAAERGILVTYPYTAKHRTLAYWASGAYAGDLQHRLAFAAAPPCEAIPFEAIRPPARPADLEQSRISLRYSALGTLKQMAMRFVHHAEFLVEDLRTGRFGRSQRKSLRAGLAGLAYEWRYFRRFERLCERSLERLAATPFVFFAFQNEPEFSVQARCKEFNDQKAIVRQLAMSLPAGMRLVIKEHAWVGMRRLSFYEDLLAIPNLVMAHPGLRAIDIIPHALAVASLAGTVTLEAALFGKMAVIFSARSEFVSMPHVKLVGDIAALRGVMREVVAERSETERLMIREAAARFISAIESIAFEAEPYYTKRR